MTRRAPLVAMVWCLAGGVTAWGQEPLTLAEAAARALEQHPAIAAADAGQREAEAGLGAARAGYYPRVVAGGSFTGGNNPVYVFGTRLSQARFTEDDFALDTLNHPSALQNFQALLSVEQTVFDVNRTRHTVRAAELAGEISDEDRRARELDVLMGVARTYFGVVVAEAQIRLAEQAVESADADLRRARSLFEGGMATRADVLAVEVHRATAVEDRIRAVNAFEIARAALNDALGVELDARWDAVTPLRAAPPPHDSLETYLATARGDRPDARRAVLGRELAGAEAGREGASQWPTVMLHGAVEANTPRLGERGGENWLAGVSVRWDLWKGNEIRSRASAARHREARAAAEERQVASASALQVREAWYQLRSARERLEVAETTVSQAEESLRIVRNRYEAGLEGVTELLRSETAVTAARYRRLAALYEQRTSRVGLERAAGRLTATSEVLR